MKYVVTIEPFDDGIDYIRDVPDNSWTMNSKIKVFDTKEEAELEASRWKTGRVEVLHPTKGAT